MVKPWVRSAALAISLFVLPLPAEAAKIVVDPGHGGKDSGAVGMNGLMEKTVTLDIARKLKNFLAERGYDAVMTRDSDVFWTLQQRVEYTNAQGADLFVSIHANDYPNPATRGSMVLYYDDAYPQSDYPASDKMKALTPQSKALAQKVLDSFVKETGLPSQGLTPSAVYVVRMGTIPSILVETAFLSNSTEAQLLADPEERTLMAKAIADGIEAYLPPDNTGFADLRGHWAEGAVLRLKAQGVVEGVGKTFEPNRMLTRAEWMTLLGRVFDLPASAAGSCAAPGTVGGAVYGGACAQAAGGAAAFKDVNAGHWSFAALDKAVRGGVLEGYPDGTLRPDRPVTRAEAAALLQRLAGAPQAPAGSRPFGDVPPDYWAASAVASLKAAGWINGVTAAEFRPEQPITRAEAAALIDRYLQSKPAKKPGNQP